MTAAGTTRPLMQFIVKEGKHLIDNPNPHAPLHQRHLTLPPGSIFETTEDMVARFGDKFERVIGGTPARAVQMGIGQMTDEQLAGLGLQRVPTPTPPAATPSVSEPPGKLPPSTARVQDSLEVLSEEELREYARQEGIDVGKGSSKNPKEIKRYLITTIQHALSQA